MPAIIERHRDRALIKDATHEATRPLAGMTVTAAGQWTDIVRSVVVVGLAWLVIVLVLMVSVRPVRYLQRQCNR